MNKYLSGIIALCILPVSAFAEIDWSGFNSGTSLSDKLLRQYKPESPNVVYRDRKIAEREGKYYMGLRGDLSFLTWKNKYTGVDSGSDKFTFKPVIGLDLSVGYRIDKKWRVDGELGYIGKYSDTETETIAGFPVEKTQFDLETYYINANGYYDLAYGLYVGAGLGLAIVDLSADHSAVANASTTNVSPMGALMFGWTYMLDEKIDFDVRYRLSIYDGGDLNIGGVNVDAGVILNNALSAGIRYHF